VAAGEDAPFREPLLLRTASMPETD